MVYIRRDGWYNKKELRLKCAGKASGKKTMRGGGKMEYKKPVILAQS
jgi:hypothetical protein